MAESRMGETSLSEIQVSDDHWGDGAEPVVKAWLRTNYDPDTMPTLQVASVTGKEGLWLLGWDTKGDWPPLLSLIFGEEYAREQLARIKEQQDDLGTVTFGERCPRCAIRRFTPYGQDRGPLDPPPPALSRTDNASYICSECGVAEAMDDMNGRPLVMPDQWPVVKPGSFGQGRL